jgi:HD-GYP domain-containing protein (c-di-GMP phosphodiesterase class II)
MGTDSASAEPDRAVRSASPAGGQMTTRSCPLRLAEAVGTLSLATDLAMGQPLEHGLRTAVLGLRMAQAMDLPDDDQVSVFYVGLLHFAGCTAESQVDARFFGDELAARPEMMAAFLGSRLGLVTTGIRVAYRGSTPVARAAGMTRSAMGGVSEFRKWARTHCDVARLLGARMGLTKPIELALQHLYERWDGKGMPGDLRGGQIPLAVRLMQVAQDADMAWQHGGPELASRILTARSGSGLDPAAVTAFLSLGDGAFDGMDAASIWDQAMLAEPGPQPVVIEERLDACLSAIADFADLKSMWTIGHSRGVASLTRRAAIAAGLPDAEVVMVSRAALVHDIGRVTVPFGVWAKPGPLTRGENEQVRLHAYHSERVLEATEGLRPLAFLAGAHSERFDGSGYHRGSKAGDLPFGAWLLAAADCYQAMREPRAYRSARSPAAAADELSREAEKGTLAPDAVNAVLAAAGRPRRPVPRPAGLSERECEVLGLLARGLATKQIARQLGISPKTCDHHIQRLYSKVGVSTRAGATVFALEHGLVSAE